MTQKSSFFIAGRHAVIEALRNPERRVIKIFLTEESKKNIHKLNPHKNLLKELKVFFKTLLFWFFKAPITAWRPAIKKDDFCVIFFEFKGFLYYFL